MSAKSCFRTLKSSRPSSRYSYVESNFSGTPIPDTHIIPEIHIQRRPKSRQKELTINDAPMMLLPKARVRETNEFYNARRTNSVVTDPSLHGLHISTIQSMNTILDKNPSKSVMKFRRGLVDRRETDSCLYSFKGAVTVDNLHTSRNTVFPSDDELVDNFSDCSYEDKDYEEECNNFPRIYSENSALSEHLDTFGEDRPVLASMPQFSPRPPSKQSQNRPTNGHKRRRYGKSTDHGQTICEHCGIALSDGNKASKSLKGLDSFLSWVMQKYAQRQELQYVPRPSYVFRGHTPHFCNFVQQMQLHNKPITASDFTGSFDSDLGEDEFIFESKEGRLIKRYRKPSDVRSISGTEGRPGSPSSQGDDSHQDDDHDRQPVTGVEFKVMSPAKTEASVKTVALPKAKEKKEERMSSSGTSNVSIPEEDEASEIFVDNMPLSSWNKGGKTIDLTQLSNSADNQNYNNSDRLPSPRQPPPSPEPIKGPRTKEIPLPVTQVKQRGCIKQKTKKPFERVRTMKNTEDKNETPPPPSVEDAPSEIPVIENEKINTKLDIKVPDLPSSIEKQKEPKKESKKPKRHLIETENDLFRQNNDDLLNEQMQLNRTEFDWLNMDMNGVEDIKRQPQTKSWIAGRLALSQQSSRFELPMDMKTLETMTPQEYIKTHCIITSRRQNLYQKIFLKNKDKTATIPYKDIDKSLKDVLVNTITSEQIQEVLKTLEIDENTKVDYKLFAGMAAFAERVLYPRFVTEDTLDMPEYQREKIECADFSALKWKFEGVHVNPPMTKLLEQIT